MENSPGARRSDKSFHKEEKLGQCGNGETQNAELGWADWFVIKDGLKFQQKPQHFWKEILLGPSFWWHSIMETDQRRYEKCKEFPSL